MKLFFTIIYLLMFVVIAFAAKPDLERDFTGQKIQGLAPNFTKDVATTGVSQTINITDNLAWKFYPATDAKFRTMSSATKVGFQHTAPGATWTSEIVNHSVTKNTFLNLSGGGVGTLRRH